MRPHHPLMVTQLSDRLGDSRAWTAQSLCLQSTSWGAGGPGGWGRRVVSALSLASRCALRHRVDLSSASARSGHRLLGDELEYTVVSPRPSVCALEERRMGGWRGRPCRGVARRRAPGGLQGAHLDSGGAQRGRKGAAGGRQWRRPRVAGPDTPVRPGLRYSRVQRPSRPCDASAFNPTEVVRALGVPWGACWGPCTARG